MHRMNRTPPERRGTGSGTSFAVPVGTSPVVSPSGTVTGLSPHTYVQDTEMTDMPVRTTQRHPDGATATAETGASAPLPSPQYAGLFLEPALPPVTDEAE